MTALSEFQDSVDCVRDIANDITSQAASALASATIRKRHETIQCSCVVMLVGYFESFIRKMAEEAVASLCSASPPFASLDPRIRSTHFEHGGRILQSKASGKRKFAWIVASQEDIARRLHSVANPTYQIVWEAFANTNANPGVDVVQDFLGNFGIKSGWQKIATANSVTVQWAKDSLDNIIVVRNECAHTGAVSIVPPPSTLTQYADNIERIAKAISSIVLSQIATIVGTSAAAPAPSATASAGAVVTAPSSGAAAPISPALPPTATSSSAAAVPSPPPTPPSGGP